MENNEVFGILDLGVEEDVKNGNDIDFESV